jgi:hypothetical protein
MMAFTPRMSRSFLCLLAACLIAALIAPAEGSAQPSGRRALINGATVVSAPAPATTSLEQQAATAAGFAVTIVPQATWAEMTQAEFGAYDLLIIGDPNCGSAPQTAAANAATWAPVVMGTAGGRTKAGNRIVVGTDPALHANLLTRPDAGIIIREGVAFAGAQVGTTGLYFSASCGGGGGNVLTALGLLSTGSGPWAVVEGSGNAVSLIASEPSFATLTTASLANWSSSVHESWSTFPSDWNALAIVTDSAPRPTCGVDPKTGASACGRAYILIAGSSIVVVSDSIALTPTTSTNPAGTTHTLTAHVTNDGVSLAGALVTFTVTGQNSGAAGSCVPADCRTNSDGNVSFTYTGSNGPGDDTINASFTDQGGSRQSATAAKHWESADFPGMTFGDWAEDIEVDVDSIPQEEREVRTAYLALQGEGVKILDVTNPEAITTLASFAPATCPNGLGTAAFFADDVEFVESLSALFVSVGRCGVLVLDVENPAEPVVLGYYDTPVWAEAVEVESFAGGEEVIGYIADHNGGLRIVDFAPLFGSTPAAPVLRGAIGSSTAGWGTGAAIDVAFLDNDDDLLVFVANSQGLRVVNVNAPASPQLIGGYDTSPTGTPPEVPQDMTLSDDGNYAFLAGWQAGLLAINVSDPSEPVLANRISTTPGLAYYESDVDDGYVFATEGKGGLRTFQISDGSLVPIDGEEAIPIAGGNGWAWDVQVVDGVAYVTYGILENGTGGLAVIELEFSDLGGDFGGDPGPDGDADGVPDADDNCAEIANPTQADANLEGFGDACDADYDDDGAVTALDFSTLRAAYGSEAGGERWNAEVDHDGDGAITAADFTVLRSRYGSSPGPSGLVCAGAAPCPSL